MFQVNLKKYIAITVSGRLDSKKLQLHRIFRVNNRWNVILQLSTAYKAMETFRKSCSIDKETFQYCSDDIITQNLPQSSPPYGW